MKKTVIYILIGLVAVLAIYHFTKDQISFSKDVSPYKAVPITTPIFIEVNGLNSIPLDNPIIRELNATRTAIPLWNFIKKVKQKVEDEDTLPETLLKEPIVVAYCFTGKKELYPLLIKKFDKGDDKKDLQLVLYEFFTDSLYKSTERKYNKETISKLTGSKNNFSYAFVDGLFLMSEKSLLVEQAIRQLKSNSLLDDHEFMKITKTITSNSEILWFINHKYFPELITKVVNDKSFVRKNEFGESSKYSNISVVDKFQNFGAWTELDMKFDENRLSLQGVTFAKDSLHHFLSCFDNQKSIKFHADELLPNYTSFFLSYTFSDKDQFFNNLEKFFTHSDNYYKREQYLKKINKGVKADILSFISSNAQSEIISATSTVPTNLESRVSYFILPVSERKDAEHQFNELIANYAARKKIDIATLKSNYTFKSENEFEIIKFPYPSLPEIVFGEPFSFAKAAYVSFYKNNLVFSNTEDGLKEYLRSMVLEATLDKNLEYILYKEELDNKANITFYANVNKSYQLYSLLFNNQVAKSLKEREENWRKFNNFSWQINADDGLFFNSIVLRHDEEEKENAITNWSLKLDNQIISKPSLTVNYKDITKKNILFQTEDHSLCKVSSDGKLQWKVKIDEKILSEIHQIDIYKNNRLQYLFNTKSKIYLIDRAGNIVKGFPKKLKSPATNGLSVFDYDKNKNYRYFIAGEDKKIYAYDKMGNSLKGWNFDQKYTLNYVTLPIQHFRVDNKDYIVFKDKNKIYIQDRRGNTRIKLNAKFDNSDNPLLLNTTGKAKIIATALNGNVYYIFFDGQFALKLKGDYSNKFKFTAGDIDGNNVIDFVYIDKNKLIVIDENGSHIFNKKFDNEISTPPNLYTFNNSLKKVGVIDSKDNRIYLYNPNGNLHQGFPLPGNTQFTIGNLNTVTKKFSLVVGDESGNLYNYSLN